ncbi:MAG: hypothetical protein R3B48_17705 [Kofleriaceae bacterium]
MRTQRRAAAPAARQRRAWLCALAATLALGLCSARSATAEDALAGGGKPWEAGVSAEARAAAEAEFLAGNHEFERSNYGPAAARYRAALAHWQHPSIQFNLAVCLINLDRAVEAMDTLQASLRFGREGLRDHFDEAHTYLRLLRDRIATLEVTIPAAARVTLDGEPLTAEPGSAVVERRLSPGRHALVARQAGFEIWSKDLSLAPGEIAREVIVMRKPSLRTVRRWTRGEPWWLLGGGAALGMIGATTLLIGNANARTIDAKVAAQCPPPEGCKELPRSLGSGLTRARREQQAGVAVAAVGAGVVVAGAILLLLNQPRQVLEHPGLTVQVTKQQVDVGWTYAY